MSLGTATVMQLAPTAVASGKRYLCTECGHSKGAHSCSWLKNIHNHCPVHVQGQHATCHVIDCGCGGFK